MNATTSALPGPLVPTVLLGLAVGFMAGTFGIGGGALLVVGLVAFGFSQHGAHATSLAAIVLTASAAVIPFALAGEIDVLAAAILAATAMTGAYFGAGLMQRIPERGLRLAFVGFLLLIALRMAFGVETEGSAVDLGALAYVGLVGVGLLTGVLSSILGIGGGLVMVPALVLLFTFGQHAAEGTSLAVVIPTAMVGAWRHTKSGYTSWRAGLILGVCGIAGGIAGANFALALQGVTLQRLFAGFLVAMAIWLLRRGGRTKKTTDAPEAPAE